MKRRKWGGDLINIITIVIILILLGIIASLAGSYRQSQLIKAAEDFPALKGLKGNTSSEKLESLYRPGHGKPEGLNSAERTILRYLSRIYLRETPLSQRHLLRRFYLNELLKGPTQAEETLFRYLGDEYLSEIPPSKAKDDNFYFPN